MKLKNIFAKGYVPNCSKEVSVIKKVKNAVSSKYVISNLNGEETVGAFYQNNCKNFFLTARNLNCLEKDNNII